MAVMTSLQGLPGFLLYFALGIAAEALFLALYMAVTPHHEVKLINAGNKAAALSLAGAVLGFTLPLASAATHSVSLLDMAVWSLVALVAQLIVFVVASLMMPGLSKRIEAGDMAAATTLATASLAIGVLNAASMSY